MINPRAGASDRRAEKYLASKNTYMVGVFSLIANKKPLFYSDGPIEIHSSGLVLKWRQVWAVNIDLFGCFI